MFDLRSRCLFEKPEVLSRLAWLGILNIWVKQEVLQQLQLLRFINVFWEGTWINLSVQLGMGWARKTSDLKWWEERKNSTRLQLFFPQSKFLPFSSSWIRWFSTHSANVSEAYERKEVWLGFIEKRNTWCICNEKVVTQVSSWEREKGLIFLPLLYSMIWSWICFSFYIHYNIIIFRSIQLERERRSLLVIVANWTMQSTKCPSRLLQCQWHWTLFHVRGGFQREGSCLRRSP